MGKTVQGYHREVKTLERLIILPLADKERKKRILTLRVPVLNILVLGILVVIKTILIIVGR